MMYNSSFKPLSSDELQGLIDAWNEDHIPYSRHQQSMLEKIKSNIFCWIADGILNVVAIAVLILMASADSWPI